MILELAELTIAPGMETEFEEGVAEAAPLFLRAKGCHSLSIHRVVETPNIYRLFVQWETIDNPMVDFRNSPDFQRWRELVSHCFAAPPVVTHSRVRYSTSDTTSL